MGLGIWKTLVVAHILPAAAPRIFHAFQVCPAPAPVQKPLPPSPSLGCLRQTGTWCLFKHVHYIPQGWLQPPVTYYPVEKSFEDTILQLGK